MFLIIYAPKVAGRIDMLSITCILVIFFSLCTNSYRYLYGVTLKKISIYSLFFLFLAAYTGLLLYMQGFDDLYQPMRFLRACVNGLGVVSLVALYCRFIRVEPLSTIIFHTWLCIILHAFIITLMFLVPTFNVFIVDHVVVVNAESDNYQARIDAMRISGLTSSWDATSAIHAIGILLIPIVTSIKNKLRSRMLIYASIPFSLLAMALSGVTGFVVLALVGAYLLISGSGIKKKLNIFIGFILIGLLLIGAVSLLSNYAPQGVQDSSLFRTAFMIIGSNDVEYTLAHRAPTAAETFSGILNEMYFIPDDPIDFLLGRGGSGRSESSYIIEADPGPTLNLHNIGFLASFMLYSLVLFSVLHAFSIRKRNRIISNFVLIIVVTILIVDSKVQYLLARNSLSLMMIALGVFWQYCGYVRLNSKSRIITDG